MKFKRKMRYLILKMIWSENYQWQYSIEMQNVKLNLFFAHADHLNKAIISF